MPCVRSALRKNERISIVTKIYHAIFKYRFESNEKNSAHWLLTLIHCSIQVQTIDSSLQQAMSGALQHEGGHVRCSPSIRLMKLYKKDCHSQVMRPKYTDIVSRINYRQWALIIDLVALIIITNNHLTDYICAWKCFAHFWINSDLIFRFEIWTLACWKVFVVISIYLVLGGTTWSIMTIACIRRTLFIMFTHLKMKSEIKVKHQCKKTVCWKVQ